MRRISVTTDSAEKASRSKGIYQVKGPAWKCRKLLVVSVRLMAKGGRQPPYIIQSNCRSKNYSVSTFKFRFILPNLHKMNWPDLVTFLHSKSLENNIFVSYCCKSSLIFRFLKEDGKKKVDKK